MKNRFDTEQFSWSDLSIQIDSRVVVGLRGISYKKTIEKEFVYAKGNDPLAIREGKISYEGEIKILQNELELLIEAAPEGDLQGLRDLLITIAYERDELVIVDQLFGVSFTEIGKALSQGETFMEVTLPIMFLGMKLNI